MTESVAVYEAQAVSIPPKLTDEAIDRLVENINQFEKFKQKALSPKDYTHFGENQYIEKPGWVKLAMALGVAFEIIGEGRRVEAEDSEGPYYAWLFRGRATTPNGRVVQMDGACSSRDEFFSMAQYKRRPSSEIDEKDIIATAQTNAFNRCMSFLCGFGELSGEEMRGKQFAPKAIKIPFGEFKDRLPESLTLPDLQKALPFWERQAADVNNKFAENNKRLVGAIRSAIAEKWGGALQGAEDIDSLRKMWADITKSPVFAALEDHAKEALSTAKDGRKAELGNGEQPKADESHGRQPQYDPGHGGVTETPPVPETLRPHGLLTPAALAIIVGRFQAMGINSSALEAHVKKPMQKWTKAEMDKLSAYYEEITPKMENGKGKKQGALL